MRAVGRAIVASGSNPGPAMAYSPAPYAFRTTTQNFGTVASDTLVISLAPWRMIPWRSTFEPIMNPGTSARKISGMLKASHSQTNRATLSEESTNRTPPRWAGWFATTPTTSPFSRPSPVRTSLANSGLISKNESSSRMPATMAYMSNDFDSSSGTMPASDPRYAGGRPSADGGSNWKFDGR